MWWIGGAVNIVTKEFSTDYLDASYEFGSYQTHKGSVFSRKNFPKSGVLLGAGGYYTSAKNDYSFTSSREEKIRVGKTWPWPFSFVYVEGKNCFHENFGSMRLVPSSGITIVSMKFQGILKNIQHAEKQIRNVYARKQADEKRGTEQPP